MKVKTRHFWEYDELKWFLENYKDNIIDSGIVNSGKFYYARYKEI